MKFPAALMIYLVMVTAALTQSGCRTNPPSPHAVRDELTANQEIARTQTDSAFVLIADGKFDKAEDHLKQATNADPFYGPAHNDLGLVYFHRNDLYNAAWEFENAAKLMPRQGAPVNNLGLVLEKAEKLIEAEKSYSAAVDLEPLNVEYAGNDARARIRLGERDEVTRHLLDLIILKDHRANWVQWARAEASRIARPIATEPAPAN